MSNEEDRRISRVAGLTLANAMLFQEVMAAHDIRVKTLRATLEDADAAGALVKEWKHILDDINYSPIFKVAYQILLNVTSGPTLDRSLRQLANVVLHIALRRAALRHDLMGRIYHRLLAEAKYLGAFYTSVPAATILLKLAMDPKYWNTDWSLADEIRKLRFADLACGTGTLLKAALQATVDNHVRACTAAGRSVKLSEIHKYLVEEVLWGFDVLPFAVHLAASALALHEPDVPFAKMSLYTLPLNALHRSNIRLGSLDLISDPRLHLQVDLFGGIGGPERVTVSSDQPQAVNIQKLDLCVMNPPFTRSVGGNLLFGTVPENERRLMQIELQRIIRRQGLQANVTAGLGSVFVALGDQLLAPAGHLALVLPRSLLAGVAWHVTRRMITSKYHLRYVVVSHEWNKWNFSENTELSETLIVARKVSNERSNERTNFVNLWHRPRNSAEALVCANQILASRPAHLEDENGICELSTDSRKFGEAISISRETLESDSWGYPAAFAQTDLVRVAYHLLHGRVYLPGKSTYGSVALIKLSEIGVIGPDRRDIHDGFKVSAGATSYPALWGYDSAKMQTIQLSSNSYLAPLTRAKRDRPLRKLTDLWPLAAKLMVAERIWLDTYRLVACVVEKPSLANVWWPVSFPALRKSADAERILALWLNSTLGVLLLLATRGETRGAWIQIKKPSMQNLPVLNVKGLGREKAHQLLQLYERVKKKPFENLAQISTDPTRREIDEGLCRAIQLPDISTIREMLGREPIVNPSSFGGQ